MVTQENSETRSASSRDQLADVSKDIEHIRIALSLVGSEFSKLFKMIGNAIVEEEKEVFSRRAISERRFDDLPVHPVRKVKPSLLLIKLADRAKR